MRVSDSVIEIEAASAVRASQTLFCDVTWRTQVGEHWALLGANGAGKTSLLQTLLGYLWPTVGRVRVLGHTLGGYDVRELRKEIGFVSANMDLRLSPSQTAREIVLTGLYASYELYEKPLEKQSLHAKELLSRMGVEDKSERPYQALSQGERQKVLIARALMSSPRLLILDEPCNGLDFPSREQLLTSLEDLMQSPGAPQLVYVTHYPDELTPSLTHALLLAHGKVVAQGAKEDVLAPDPLSQAFGVPVTVIWQEGYPIVRMQRSH